MRRLLSAAIICLSAISMASAGFDAAHSDRLFYNLHGYDEDLAYLEDALEDASSDEEKAAILWRLSRTVLTITDGIEGKDARLAGYAESEGYADQSLSLAETPDGYFWKASAIGRTGQVNGPLNSLMKARPMLELCLKVQDDFGCDMSDCWYVMGLLYNQLPGSPISFGNKEYAISYMRRCIDTQDTANRLNLANYLELAQQLHDRNWDAGKRTRELDRMKASYDSNTVPSEKMKFYEGKDGSSGRPFYSTVTLGSMSDAQEAVMLCQYALALYSIWPEPLASDDERKAEIEGFLGRITK